MKRRLSLFLALALVCLCLLPMMTSCTPGTEQFTLALTDASGAGTITTKVVFSSTEPENTPYVKNVKKLAEGLQAQTDALTRTEDIYHIGYGTQGDSDFISLTFSFTDINDYNRKCLRLYNSGSDSKKEAVNKNQAIDPAKWTLSDNGDGTYKATFSQNGAAFTYLNLWAYDYLMSHDIEDAWDYTGSGQNTQYQPFTDQGYSFVLSTDAFVTLTVGDKTRTVSAYHGSTPQTVTLSGTVSGTPVTVETEVSDESLIVSDPVPEEKEPTYPALDAETQKAYDALCDISLDLPTDRVVKVACVGDSITNGTDDHGYPSYPRYLQDILGDGFDVENFGKGMMRLISSDGNDVAYTNCEWYQPSLDFNPDVVIIMLGTNDSADYTFKRFNDMYASDYQALIDSYKNLPSHPYVIVATCPYAVATSGSGTGRINEYIAPYQRELFTKLNGVDGIVDIAEWSADRYYMYIDGIHYNAEGYYSLAMTYAEHIFGIANGYRTVKVTAVPGAIVSLDKNGATDPTYTLNVKADEQGIATCYAQDGSYTLTVRADDYALYQGAVSVSGDCAVTCDMVAGDHNVALYHDVTASSGDNADLVNDEDHATLWQPNENGAEGAYLIFDLSETKEIHGIRIESWFQAYVSSYRIEVSDDGQNYTEVTTITGANSPGMDEHYFDSASGRYVKLTLLKKGYMYNYEIYDVQLLSDDERTVTQREKDAIAAREAAEKAAEQDDTSEEQPTGKTSSFPWFYAGCGAAAAALIAALAVVTLKKKKQ